MKIIAETDKGYMLDASADEIAKLLGYRGTYDSDFRQGSIKLGNDIDVGAIGTISSYVKNLDKNELQSIKHNLEGVIKNIDGAMDKVQSMNLFETIKEVSNE